jgi:hypothetical protein
MEQDITQDAAVAITGAERIEGARWLAVRSALKLEIRTGMKLSGRGRPARVLANAITGQDCRTKAAAYAALDAHITEAFGEQFARPLP